MTYFEIERETELAVLNYTIQEAEEAFTKLRKDYNELRNHADVLEAILNDQGIDYPEFCGW